MVLCPRSIKQLQKRSLYAADTKQEFGSNKLTGCTPIRRRIGMSDAIRSPRPLWHSHGAAARMLLGAGCQHTSQAGRGWTAPLSLPFTGLGRPQPPPLQPPLHSTRRRYIAHRRAGCGDGPAAASGRLRRQAAKRFPQRAQPPSLRARSFHRCRVFYTLAGWPFLKMAFRTYASIHK